MMNKQILRNTVFVGLFLVPFIPFLVSSSLFFPFITTKAFAFRFIVEIVFAAWLLLAFVDQEIRLKKSLILYAVAVFLVVIGLADILGVAPLASFWSNFERMEGYITLAHLGMLFVVASSVFGESLWRKWWNTSLIASFLMVCYCLLQIMGVKTINQGGVRVDGTLGNAIYLAVYMLFHTFIAILFFSRERKDRTMRWLYGILIFLQILILYYTATRGAILGLLGGLLVMALLNLRNKEDTMVRKTSVGIVVGLLAVIGLFFVLRTTSFVADSPVLSRFSALSASELKTQGRYFVWPIALKGFKEKPLLGWGQENFPYVFQKYYQPEMYRLEPWFDRAHNIFLDWMVAGGLLGLVSYLLLYVALLFSIWKKALGLTHTEKSILSGLIVAYFFHNFFVFDNLISYILFFTLLAYLHSRSAGAPLFSKVFSTKITLPLVGIVLVLALYFGNVKPLIGNVFLIEALKSLQIPGQMAQVPTSLQRAYGASELGRLEITEYSANSSYTILTGDITLEEKNRYFSFTKGALETLVASEAGGNNARSQIIFGSFLVTTGFPNEALVHLEKAKSLMPGKQQIYFEIGGAYIAGGEKAKALETFKQAYELNSEYTEAKVVYLIGAIYAGDYAIERKMISELPAEIVSRDDRIIAAYEAVGR